MTSRIGMTIISTMMPAGNWQLKDSSRIHLRSNSEERCSMRFSTFNLHLALGQVTAPTLIVHGTRDTFVPIESSRRAVGSFAGETRLVEIEGAQHGLAVHDDPEYQNPQTREWQERVILTVADWLSGN